jgi:simple sugar transport system ATP-binding protein
MGEPVELVSSCAYQPTALRLRGLTKSFCAARVLGYVDFDLQQGEIHALLGENGAGKSTLMNILTGIYAADGGIIEIDGAPAAIRSPAMALGLRVGMVHLHFRLAAPVTARENVALAAGALPAMWRRGVIEARFAEAMARTELDVPLE